MKTNVNIARTEALVVKAGKKLDFQGENQPRAAYIGKTALVRVRQCPSQTISELKFSVGRRGVTRTMYKLDNVQVGQCLS